MKKKENEEQEKKRRRKTNESNLSVPWKQHVGWRERERKEETNLGGAIEDFYELRGEERKRETANAGRRSWHQSLRLIKMGLVATPSAALLLYGRLTHLSHLAKV